MSRSEYWKSIATHSGELPGYERREFLQLLGASMALAGASGCALAEPDDKIVPYDVQPPEVTPGRPSFYATAMPLDGWGVGLLVESHTGRPTKVEGNPAHPASLGAAGVFEQASVLGLYDPARAKETRLRESTMGYRRFADAL